MRGPSRFVAALVSVVAVSSSVRAQTPNVPTDPIDAVVTALESHDLVGVPAGKDHLPSHDLMVRLLNDPRVVAAVDDIAVEFGTARYQDVADRFVAGESVPERELRRIWEDTTVADTHWDLPIYEEFFRLVRDINQRTPPGQQIRVLLGDPPIEWEHVATALEHREWVRDMARDRHPAALIELEVLDRGRKGLIYYGFGHLQRRKPTRRPDIHSIVGYLLASTEARVFTIMPAFGHRYHGLVGLQPDIGDWLPGQVSLLRGTVVGAAPWRLFNPIPESKRAGDALAEVTLAEQFDAIVYFGPPEEQGLSELDPARCLDDEWMTMRLGRLALVSC